MFSKAKPAWLQSAVHMYDFTKAAWTEMTPMQTGRDRHGCGVVTKPDGTLAPVVAGGHFEFSTLRRDGGKERKGATLSSVDIFKMILLFLQVCWWSSQRSSRSGFCSERLHTSDGRGQMFRWLWSRRVFGGDLWVWLRKGILDNQDRAFGTGKKSLCGFYGEGGYF